MKKSVLIAAIATIGLVFNTHAQSSSFAIKGGANFARLTGDDAGDVETRTSFHVGGAFEIMLSDAFSFQPEFLYSSQGYKVPGNENNQLKLDYINIPFMAKLYVAKGFNIQAGPQVGFLLSAEAETVLFGLEVSGDVTEFYEKVDLGANLGLGYKLPFGLFFDVRYNIGLRSVRDDNDIDIKNNVMQLSMGFLF